MLFQAHKIVKAHLKRKYFSESEFYILALVATDSNGQSVQIDLFSDRKIELGLTVHETIED